MTVGRLEDDFSKNEIAKRCEAALHLADAVGVFPTPLDHILDRAGAGQIVDIGDIPQKVKLAKPKLLKRLLGAVIYRESTVFVDLAQRGSRALWTKGHETTHFILPWHEASAIHLDDNERLFGDSAEQLEIEANYGAAQLIFQGHRAMQEALDYRHGLAVPLMLAERTGASIHASIRYYVEHHPDPMALATTGRRRSGEHLPIYLLTHSASWPQQFSRPDQVFGQQQLKVKSGPFAELLSAPKNGDDIRIADKRLRDLRGDLRPIAIETFDNHYNKFFLIRMRGRVELGRRLQAVTKLA